VSSTVAAPTPGERRVPRWRVRSRRGRGILASADRSLM
jgi:hypothetical protein